MMPKYLASKQTNHQPEKAANAPRFWRLDLPARNQLLLRLMKSAIKDFINYVTSFQQMINNLEIDDANFSATY